MRYDADSGHYGNVVDNRTGESIPWAVWADDTTGEVERLVVGPDGHPEIDPATGDLKRELLTGVSFTFVPAASVGITLQPIRVADPPDAPIIAEAR